MMTSFREYISALAQSLGFLTRLSLPQRLFSTPYKVAETVPMFPFAGAIIGIIGAIVLVITNFIGFPSLISTILAILALVISTGALHEDGLADVTDAFFVNKPVSERLIIMKDSRTGVFGVIALILSIMLRVALVNEIIVVNGILIASLALIAVESFSRVGMVHLWGSLPLARTDGTAAKAGLPSDADVKLSLFSGLILFICLLILGFGFLAWLPPLIIYFILYYSVKNLCIQKIGGITGDTLGAAQQTFLIGLLLGIVLIQ